MFARIAEILAAVKHPYNFQTLKNIEFTRMSNGAIKYSTGNNVVLFHVKIEGEEYAMRCYKLPKPYLRELYDESYLHNELDVGEHLTTKLIDIVLCRWVEGCSLAIVAKSGDKEMFRSLATKFDQLALSLINEEWAHGDLSPDNIIVDNDGELHLIDLDARYTPQLKGMTSSELGTPAYQSPNRDINDFNSRIDDFSIVIISSSLHALSIEPDLNTKFPFLDGLLLNGAKVVDEGYETMNYVLELFAMNGYFRQYRALKALRFNRITIDNLPDLLLYKELSNCNLELFISWGLCGYCDAQSGEVIIQPLYDEAFEFRGDYALVRLSRWWFYIDKSGRAVEHCGEWRCGKPAKRRAQ